MMTKKQKKTAGGLVATQILLPADRKAAYVVAAKSCGMTLTAWIDDCCLANLPASVQRTLSDRPEMGRPKDA